MPRWCACEAGWRHQGTANRHGKRACAIRERWCNRASQRRLDTLMAVVYRSASRSPGEVCREENLSAAQQEPKAHARLPRPHEDARRARGAAAPPGQGTSAPGYHHLQEVAGVRRGVAPGLSARTPAAQTQRLCRDPDRWQEGPHQVFSGGGAKRRWPGWDHGDKEDWQRGDSKSAEAAHPRICQAGGGRWPVGADRLRRGHHRQVQRGRPQLSPSWPLTWDGSEREWPRAEAAGAGTGSPLPALPVAAQADADVPLPAQLLRVLHRGCREARPPGRTAQGGVAPSALQSIFPRRIRSG